MSSSFINERTVDDVCTQKIKPDSLCYNPNHYDDVRDRMQALNIRQTNGEIERRRSEHFDASSRSANRRSLYDNVMDQDTPSRSPERQISSTKIYLQPSKREGDRVARSYDPTRYASYEADQVRQPKVYYQGASDTREPSLRSKSYANGMESAFTRVPFNMATSYNRPSPPSYQQTKGSVHNSTVTSTPWYQDDSYSEQLDHSSSPSNLRAISAKMIPDKLVCERCCQIPVSRHQKICSVCEQATYQRHKQINDTT